MNNKNMSKIFIILLVLFMSCNCGVKKQNDMNDVAEKQEVISCPFDSIQVDTITSTLTNEEAIYYFSTFRNFLLNMEFEKLSDLMLFPIGGDYSWEQMNEEGETIRVFNSYLKKEDFLKYHSMLFTEDLVDLFKKVNFEKMFEQNYSVKKVKGANVELYLTIDVTGWLECQSEQKRTINIEMDYNQSNCDVCERGIIYRFEEYKQEIKLCAIQFVG